MTAPVIPIKSKRKVSEKPTPRKRHDWDAIERDYRTTNLTDRELAKIHGISHVAIFNRAKNNGWARDLTQAVKAATNTKLLEATVNAQINATVNLQVNAAMEKASQTAKSTAETVMAMAEVRKDVVIGHRTGLNRLVTIKAKLLDQIEQAAANMVDLAEVIEMVRQPDDNGIDRANDALKKAMGRSALVDDLKKLADVDEKVRKGEREAFGLDTEPSKDQKADTIRLTDAERAVRLMDMLASRKQAETDQQRRAA